MEESFEKVRHLLGHVPHVAIATVNEDGTPHNTPVFGTFNNKLHLFWASDPGVRHSQNIRRSGEAFVVIFDSHGGGDGLYMAGRAEEINDAAHLDYAHALMVEAKARFGGSVGSRERYEGEASQRFYRFIPEAAWMHYAVKDADGYFITDRRISVSLDELTL